MNKMYHVSVLLSETIEALNVKQGKQYIDATLGGGGHTAQILEKGGKVLGIDADQDAINYVTQELGLDKKGLVIAKGNFKDIDRFAKENDFTKVAGILFDLGISSHHVDEAQRGFSFQKEGPLDMRMDQDLGVTASDLINVLNKSQLIDLFTRFGEERFAKVIAGNIVKYRTEKPIKTTSELSQIINRVVPRGGKDTNPSTRVFQALRIAVNDELTSIEVALPKAIELLEPKGRLTVISFHSLEDRIVKNVFRDFAERGVGQIITKKPLIPTDAEQEQNKRSRSAKLRIFEKV